MATQTLRERYQIGIHQATSEQEYQRKVREVVKEARQTIRAAKCARKVGHDDVWERARKTWGIDPYRQDALVDFYTGLIEDEAREIKAGAQTTLIVRRTFRPLVPKPQTLTKTEVERLKKLGVL